MSVPSIRALIDARRATSAPHVPRVRPADVLDRVFPRDLCDDGYGDRWAAPRIQTRTVNDEGEVA